MARDVKNTLIYLLPAAILLQFSRKLAPPTMPSYIPGERERNNLRSNGIDEEVDDEGGKLIYGVDRVQGMVDEMFRLHSVGADDGLGSHASIEKLTFEFPSVMERVKYYMGSWYSNVHQINVTLMCSKLPLFNHKYHLLKAGDAYIFNRSNIDDYPARNYIADVKKNILSHAMNATSFLAAAKLGDRQNGVEWPIFIKTRQIHPDFSGVRENTSSILALLNEGRHFSARNFEVAREDNIEWEQKNDSLVWRGGTSGTFARLDIVEKYFNATDDGIDVAFSSIGKTGLTQLGLESVTKRYLRGKLSVEELLKHKYLLSIEGNDVASGLKWMLYSKSVVFMTPPKVESWAMEALLVPYYHYIPLAPDHSDIRQKVEWARRNDDLCHRISKQATRYMEDLFVSPRARNETGLIHKTIVRRYESLYEGALSKCRKS